VVVTDITRREATSLMGEMWAETKKFTQGSGGFLRQLGLGDALNALADEEACVAKTNAGFDAWLRSCNACVCKEEADMAAILDDYFSKRPPFGKGKKKSEFPDVLVISSLRRWATTSRQRMYLVSTDGDFKWCCGADTPFVFASSVREILSHGIASARVHELVLAIARDSSWLSDRLAEDAGNLEVTISRGSIRGARVEVEVRSVQLEGMEVSDVVIDGVDGDTVSCTAYVHCELEMRVVVDQEPVQNSEDDWDLGSRHEQRISVWHELSASVSATLGEDGSVDFFNGTFDDRTIRLSWRDVERDIDANY